MEISVLSGLWAKFRQVGHIARDVHTLSHISDWRLLLVVLLSQLSIV
jgi:hypothetical protein